jgi:hypothetical protein
VIMKNLDHDSARFQKNRIITPVNYLQRLGWHCKPGL